MLYYVIICLSIFFKVHCGRYDHLIEDLFPSPMPDCRIHSAECWQRLRNSKTELDEFEKKLEPFAKMISKFVRGEATEEERKALIKLSDEMIRRHSTGSSLSNYRQREINYEEETTPAPKSFARGRSRIYTVREDVRRAMEKFKDYTKTPNNQESNLPNYIKLELAYEKNVSVPLKELQTLFQLYRNDSNATRLNEFADGCHRVSKIADFLNNFDGWRCMNSTLSATTAWTLFELIDQIRFTKYWLSTDEEKQFKKHFAVLYFYMADRNMDIASEALQNFITKEAGFLYENKLYLLKRLIRHLRIDIENASMSDCLPLTTFIQSHFNRTVLLEKRLDIGNDVHSLKKASLECANLIRLKNSVQAEKLITDVDVKTAFLEPFLSDWFESLLESTWPEIETQLIRGIVKESAFGRPVQEISKEYERIASVVLYRMKSIGNPNYVRQYVITKDVTKQHPNRDFEFQCKWNSCSRGTSMDAQFIVLRTANSKMLIQKNRISLEGFTKNITQTVTHAMEKKYKNEQYLPYAIHRLALEEGVSLEQDLFRRLTITTMGDFSLTVMIGYSYWECE